MNRIVGTSHLTALIATLGLAGCLTSADGYLDNLQDKCNITSDQKASFMPPVKGQPAVNVVADARFTDDERQQLQAAVDEWNLSGKYIRGDAFFALTFAAISDDALKADPRDCSAKFGSSDSFYVVREDSNARWRKFGFNDQTPGVTLRCLSGSDVTQQIVYLKIDLIDHVQLKSIALHELGHSLGLDHSCNSDADHDDFRGCSRVKAGHPYRQAVMFPSLRAKVSPDDVAEIKDQLRDNDKERAKCLYNPL